MTKAVNVTKEIIESIPADAVLTYDNRADLSASFTDTYADVLEVNPGLEEKLLEGELRIWPKSSGYCTVAHDVVSTPEIREVCVQYGGIIEEGVYEERIGVTWIVE